MKYLIMLAVIIGLAAADFLTGIIKAYIANDLSSSQMRTGVLHKLAEIIIMTVACGLETGIEMLGRDLHSEMLAELAGNVAAGLIFAYIVLTEIISVLENYGEISPDAVWVRSIIRKLRSFRRKDDKNVHTETDET
ncbi:MAG: phage holin family protein [Oscillospiraceae bacterium]|nr:phage holin family protein [Oscillospiraceae bacterium]